MHGFCRQMKTDPAKHVFASGNQFVPRKYRSSFKLRALTVGAMRQTLW